MICIHTFVFGFLEFKLENDTTAALGRRFGVWVGKGAGLHKPIRSSRFHDDSVVLVYFASYPCFGRHSGLLVNIICSRLLASLIQ